MSYAGESIGKKFARLEFWSLRNFKLLNQKGRKILIFASAEGGDASCLLGFGVPPENILAIDTDPTACESFRLKFPDVECLNCSSDDVHKAKPGLKLDVAYLDFCGALSNNTTNMVRNILPLIKTSGVLGVTFLKGRDGWNKEEVVDHRERIRGGSYPKETLQISSERPALVNMYSRGMRLSHDILNLPGSELGDAPTPVLTNLISYQSTSPMMIGVYRVIGVSRMNVKNSRMNAGNWKRRAKQIPGIRNNVLDMFSILEQRSEDELREFVLENADDPNIHLKMNLKKQQVAAWKAHRTMGTYDV